ncbi:MAG: hypothetical protein CTY38_07145 [Methylotenera sp.]|uniref:hypothetical protein n=1 Tax=Methylotenera sp. TaxID=2051956 RepID=UPI000D40E0BD|nr:hypothetical protein [Methylotenera sp.]PPC82142.1 MAG: hypothetical protein CTY38_07145 [Methylotenera sp.]
MITTTLGEAWSEDKVASYIPKLKAALVEPYLQQMELSETYAHITSGKPKYAEYWIIAEEGGYFEWFDPSTEEFGLAQRSTIDNEKFLSIGVRGDLVGVYCAI